MYSSICAGCEYVFLPSRPCVFDFLFRSLRNSPSGGVVESARPACALSGNPFTCTVLFNKPTHTQKKHTCILFTSVFDTFPINGYCITGVYKVCICSTYFTDLTLFSGILTPTEDEKQTQPNPHCVAVPPRSLVYHICGYCETIQLGKHPRPRPTSRKQEWQESIKHRFIFPWEHVA